ncbi:hypothetical protein EIP86_009575 [Pleurotus ostreatoroseus]|nr:hypothetical protein EIP86_009575 [Pleurotus ostreatoroseus]
MIILFFQPTHPKTPQFTQSTIFPIGRPAVVLDTTLHDSDALQPRSENDKFFIEEIDHIKTEISELTILSEVDSLLLNDDYLGAAILDAIAQSSAKPTHVIQFVLMAVSSRLEGLTISHPLHSPLDLQRLSKRAWNAISEIVAVTVLNGLRIEVPRTAVWLQDAMFILLSTSNELMTPNARRAVLQCMLEDSFTHWVARAIAEGTSSAVADYSFIAARFIELLSQHDIRPEDLIVVVLKIAL